ncbi:MAG: tol-pal system protein YbgF [Deltaproteobacteria bacterium]|nr:tol-pal system protein YbgF [Deltaproteobacteria bacterium]
MTCKSIVVLVFVAGIMGCAASGDISLLDQRVNDLERQNRILEKELETSGGSVTSRLQDQQAINERLQAKSAELTATFGGLRREVQILSGKIEESDYSYQQGRQLLKSLGEEKENKVNRIEEIARLNRDRILRLEQYLDYESPATGPEQKVDSHRKAALKSDVVQTEAELYGSAKEAFDSGQFEVARDKFRQLLQKYPKSKNADNAQFWVGEIYYREKWYEKAIMEYQKVIENYPDGNKVPSSLLKQGLAFFNLDEKANARLILQEMIKKYPASPEAKIAKDKLSTFK